MRRIAVMFATVWALAGPAEDVETGPMLGHESLPTVWSVDTPNRERGLSAVNNVCGKYT